jgi:uncharacterized Ntn-hydrolase superfamily protein
MTYSIVAWDEATGMTGVAVATKHLAVGSLVPHARAGVGAVATQANTNPYLGCWGLDRLESYQRHSGGTLGARETLDSLLQDDPGRDGRQVHLVDARGNSAAWTGPECAGHAGHICFDGYSVAGNYLTGPEPLEAMARGYREALDQGQPFELRLLRAIEACDMAGGDRRGRQSAALLVMHRESYPLFDFRVDHHPDPLRMMGEILEQTRQSYYVNFRATLPTDASVAAERPNPFPMPVPQSCEPLALPLAA